MFINKFFRILTIVLVPLVLSSCLITADDLIVFKNGLLNTEQLDQVVGTYINESTIDNKKTVSIFTISSQYSIWSNKTKPVIKGGSAPFIPSKRYLAAPFTYESGSNDRASKYEGVAILSYSPNKNTIIATVPASSLKKRSNETGKLTPLIFNSGSLFFTLTKTPQRGLQLGFFDDGAPLLKQALGTTKPNASATKVLKELSNGMQPSRQASFKLSTVASLARAKNLIKLGYMTVALNKLKRKHTAQTAKRSQSINTNVPEKTLPKKGLIQLNNPDGWYDVSNSGINRVSAKKAHSTIFTFSVYAKVVGEVNKRALRRNSLVEKGHWDTHLKSWLSKGHLPGVTKACGRQTFTSSRFGTYKPIVSNNGQQVIGAYRYKSTSSKRFCRIGSFSARTCKLVKCQKWSDHPDFNNGVSYLIKDYKQAKKIYASLQKWTHQQQGLGSVSNPNKRRNNNSGYSASEDARQTTEDVLIDWWGDNL